MITFGNWLTVVGWVVGLLLSALVVLLALWGGLWVLRKVIVPTEYPALSVLLAIVGGLLALYQANRTYRDKQDQQARTLQYANDTATRLMFLASFQDQKDNGPDLRAVPREMLTATAARVNAYGSALAVIDPATLPSAASMGGLLRARAASSEILARYQTSIKDQTSANIDQGVANLAGAVQELQSERDRLYPVYKAGPLLVGALPQQR